MRGFRLNGWQRIGIVLSVVWAIAVIVWDTLEVIRHKRLLSQCLSGADPVMNYCARTYEVPWFMNAMIVLAALAPIPIAWLLVWGLVALVRWVRRGFQPST